ncbi:MAG: GntR family transcriptional regulator [Erythrobacter sp.]
MAQAAAPATKKTPRYMQVAGELREAITAGRYAEGRQFPTETALCSQYNVSRFTVREALKRLQSEGLIERKRGSGTVVQPASARGGALHQPLSNVGELLQYARGSEVTYAELGSGPLPSAIADQIEENTLGTWRRFTGTRRQSAGTAPIAVTDAYFHEKLGDAVDRLDLGAGTLFSQIEKLTGTSIGRVTQDIQAIAADEAIAKALDIERDQPVLRIIRCYLDPKGGVYEISVSHHPGDRFAYAMHIDLDS